MAGRAGTARESYEYGQASNLPVQGACFDASALALTFVDEDLSAAGIAGGPVAWIHDEIVLEVPEAEAGRAEAILGDAMRRAFADTFPGAPLRGLVDSHVGRTWADNSGGADSPA